MKEDTKIVTAGRHPEDHYGVVNPPVYHASTIIYPSTEVLRRAIENPGEGVFYGRRGTPTTFSLQEAMTELEGGHATKIYPSGLAAITTALLAFLKAGDHLLMVDSVYGPSRSFCDSMLKRLGIETTYYDPLVGSAIGDLMRDTTAVVFTEVPGSLTFEMQDIPAISEAAHKRGAIVMMDNTWATPLYFKPLAKGADVSIQAATKYIVGHSDAMLGTATANEAAWPALEATTHELGTCAGPDDIYLGQRGLRTMSVRLERHSRTALRLAEWLKARPEVARILYPPLPDDPGHDIWRRDFTGASGLFGVVLQPCSDKALDALLEGCELFGMGYSWGGYESLIVPAHYGLRRTGTTWDPPGPTIRIHAGLEDPDDLLADLEQALGRFAAAA